jgi:hypothetical protein
MGIYLAKTGRPQQRKNSETRRMKEKGKEVEEGKLK